VLCSDLLGDGDGIFKGLQMLRRRGHDVAVLHVMDEDEIDFPFDGPTRFEGLELPDALNCNPRALRAGYLAALEEFLAGARSRAAATGCDYALIRTDEPLDAAMVRFLARRASLAV
jgi:glycine/D-amino acid oxidase-like deaminating enzyme